VKKSIIVAIILVFSLSFSALAVDFQTVNQKSVEAFLEIYPQYLGLMERYGQKIESAGSFYAASEAAPQYIREFEDLLGSFGVSLENFIAFLQKITTGMARVQIEESGADPMFSSIAMQIGGALAPEELGVIREYFDQIDEVLSE